MKTTGALKNVMQEGQNGCKYNSIRAIEEQITVARTKQQEEEKENSGVRPVGRESKGIKREIRQARQQVSLLPRSRSPR